MVRSAQPTSGYEEWESLQQGGELHVRCQALQDSEMQTASDDTILSPDCLNPIVQ